VQAELGICTTISSMAVAVDRPAPPRATARASSLPAHLAAAVVAHRGCADRARPLLMRSIQPGREEKKTKSMFILDNNKNKKIINKLENEFKKGKSISTEKLFQRIKKNITWLDVKYGEVILFNPALPHGARKNLEKETRFSINCRFKGIFTPYGDKKIGEFFLPITTRAITEVGMNFEYPFEKK
jgi:hypothetical protein